MPEDLDRNTNSVFLCASCLQAFVDYHTWRDHADGPFASVAEAKESLVELEPGEAIPAGARVGEGKCSYPDEDHDPVEWTDIEQGDLVYDQGSGRAVGIVGHRDDQRVDIERFAGGIETCGRGLFAPDARYIAVRVDR